MPAQRPWSEKTGHDIENRAKTDRPNSRAHTHIWEIQNTWLSLFQLSLETGVEFQCPDSNPIELNPLPWAWREDQMILFSPP